MHVMVLGANGFIGAAMVSALLRAGHAVTGVVRDAEVWRRRFPAATALQVDLCRAESHQAGFWRPHLTGIDGVVNAAGVLQPRRDRDAWAVHRDAPAALFQACEAAGVVRVIQISAVGIGESETVFARSKAAGDAALMARDLPWTLLRPTVVIGEGSYGGTSFLRALAAFPLAVPLIGDGGQEMDFIHKDDLAAGVVALLESDRGAGRVLEPASPERMTLRRAVLAYRGWLGLKGARTLSVPFSLASALARLGDVAQLHPVTTTALAQFQGRLTGDGDGFARATGVAVRGLSATLAGRPAETQDLWHARLYLLRPVVRLVLALLWLVSGLLGLFGDAAQIHQVLAPLTGDASLSEALARVMGALDLAIALALILAWRLKFMAAVQLTLVLGYTLGLSLVAPGLWGDLFGGLLKNLPIIALILVHRVLEQER